MTDKPTIKELLEQMNVQIGRFPDNSEYNLACNCLYIIKANLRTAFTALEKERDALKEPYDKLAPSAVKFCLDTLHAKYEPDSSCVFHAFNEYEKLQSSLKEHQRVLGTVVPLLPGSVLVGFSEWMCPICKKNVDEPKGICTNPPCPDVQARALLDAETTPDERLEEIELNETDHKILE